LAKRFVNFIFYIIAIVMILRAMGFEVTGLLAGLGIGGLAFALAAKDMLANLFGGVTILSDKPFKLGDRIKVAGYDGWVKEIGLRSTRIMTLDGFLMIIPNSMVANSAIENVSEEDKRKVVMTIGVEYSTTQAKMKKAKEIIERVVKKNKDTDDKALVSFTEFADSSLNFLVIYWIKNLDDILGAKHNINMEIKKEFEKAKISMAFPTRTVHLKK
jgi:MscS family membrane protein